MISLTVGYTRTDRPELRDRGYFPTLDGYRPGAPQDLLTISADLRVDDPIAAVESVYVATNAPMAVIDHDSNARAVYDAIVEAVRLDPSLMVKSLSVGDTVTVTLPGGEARTFSCDHCGWTLLDETTGSLIGHLGRNQT